MLIRELRCRLGGLEWLHCSPFALRYSAPIQPPNSAPNIPRLTVTKFRLVMSKEQEKTAACAFETTGPGDPVLQLSNRFTKSEKWFIVGFIAFVALFRQGFIMPGFETLPNCFYYSPLTSNIYLPAIPDIVVAFHKSTEFIYLTVRLSLNCLPNLPT